MHSVHRVDFSIVWTSWMIPVVGAVMQVWAAPEVWRSHWASSPPAASGPTLSPASPGLNWSEVSVISPLAPPGRLELQHDDDKFGHHWHWLSPLLLTSQPGVRVLQPGLWVVVLGLRQSVLRGRSRSLSDLPPSQLVQVWHWPSHF